jgi:hypothetical protein
MKELFIKLLFIFLLDTMAFSQFFEGKIVYENKYQSKLPNMTDQQFSAMMGNIQEFHIKGGNYKSALNGTLLQWQLYSNADNKLYTKMAGSQAVLWNDGAVNSDEVRKAEINRGVIEILGYSCDELILTCKNSVQRYYFSSHLKADPKLFENHKLYNWYEYVSRANALPLKMIIDNQQFVLECTAVEIKAMSLDDALFQLPAGTKLEKSPY